MSSLTLQDRLDRLEACVTSDDVAKLLTYVGVKGVPKSPFACPLVNWLTEADDCSTARVARGELYAEDERGCVLAEKWFNEWSVAVGVFVDRFDHGQFPDLEKKEEA